MEMWSKWSQSVVLYCSSAKTVNTQQRSGSLAFGYLPSPDRKPVGHKDESVSAALL